MNKIVEIINILNLKDHELLHLSKSRLLSLNLEEMKTIQKYFQKEKRNPYDLELEVIAQTWSEHCKHKIFNSSIEVKEKNKTKIYKNLFKETVVKATKTCKQKLGKNDYTVSVFKDNAGIIKFNNKYNICFKVETHNHPSALDPFGGANTGLGGVIRDILGTGLCATPVANTDIFCFANPDFDNKKLPVGVLHPQRIYQGVVAGIRDYGNKIGIPTVNGSIHFDNRYLGNPLVYAGTIGMIPKAKSFKHVKVNDYIVVVGGRTGKDGIHGATFSSIELDHKSEETSSTAVQIGDPITEKKFMDVLVKARDLNLFNALTDCGAGGFSSAVGEMSEGLGAEVNLDEVRLKHQNMKAWEIFLSESQERMVLSVPDKNLKKLIALFEIEDVEIFILGKFVKTNRLKIYYKNQLCSNLDLTFLHEGLPQKHFKINHTLKTIKNQSFKEKKEYTEDLLNLLSSYEISSKEHVIRGYDFEVKGGTVLKPLHGVNQGPGDGAVVIPDHTDLENGIAIAHGINVRYGDIDPFWMTLSSIDEAIRNYLAIGGMLNHSALLDNFCWGNPENPEKLHALVRTAEACYQASTYFNLPFISGKDSFYNEFKDKNNKNISIPNTLLISIFGKIKIKNLISMDFKKPGNKVFILGETYNELGGSCFFQQHNLTSNNVPKVDFKKAFNLFSRLQKAIEYRLVLSIHDISDGGCVTALAEMALAGNIGFSGSLKYIPVKNIKHNFETLFSESNSRFIIEVDEKKHTEFQKFFKGISIGLIGETQETDEFMINDKSGKTIIQSNIKELDNAWRRKNT